MFFYVFYSIYMVRKITTEQAREMQRKGMLSGRTGKKGKHKTTLLKEQAYEIIQQKIVDSSLSLVNTQRILAHGAIKIYKIITKTTGSGKNKKTYREKPELVTSEWEIEAVIDYEYGDGDNPNDDANYYFIVTQEPDNKAIDSQLNRVFGKAPATIDLTSKGKQIPVIGGMQIILEQQEDGDI